MYDAVYNKLVVEERLVGALLIESEEGVGLTGVRGLLVASLMSLQELVDCAFLLFSPDAFLKSCMPR